MQNNQICIPNTTWLSHGYNILHQRYLINSEPNQHRGIKQNETNYYINMKSKAIFFIL